MAEKAAMIRLKELCTNMKGFLFTFISIFRRPCWWRSRCVPRSGANCPASSSTNRNCWGRAGLRTSFSGEQPSCWPAENFWPESWLARFAFQQLYLCYFFLKNAFRQSFAFFHFNWNRPQPSAVTVKLDVGWSILNCNPDLEKQQSASPLVVLPVDGQSLICFVYEKPSFPISRLKIHRNSTSDYSEIVVNMLPNVLWLKQIPCVFFSFKTHSPCWRSTSCVLSCCVFQNKNTNWVFLLCRRGSLSEW